MINATQLLLILVIIVIVTMLSIIGAQVFFILKEFQTTLQKANKILDDTQVIPKSISKKTPNHPRFHRLGRKL